MKPAVARQEAERGPVLEDTGVGCAMETADGVAPEAEAAGGEWEASPQGLGHRLVARRAAAIPVHGHWSARRRWPMPNGVPHTYTELHR